MEKVEVLLGDRVSRQSGCTLGVSRSIVFEPIQT